ncbi:diaminopimelate epimerase [Actinomyces gaoshouyii]|uniref:Diaminopimelate epimerase n=1 Tax=Actinomyces gaoshouyii TaxID=1960083 RepID=A0A8H9LLX4_9ACTO|nr:diaminopimelate epimerase [Actinomyces gaoshouyii]GGO99203.1 diaminopimelate epimerase [Actinomyces gaoshouyii]
MTTSTRTGLAGHELIKGRAAGDDLLMLVDPDCDIPLTAADIAAVCDRRAGVGASGLVRVVRTANLPGAERFAAAVPEAEWFMDHYGADGAVAETAPGAVLLLAQTLIAESLDTIPEGASVTIGTRGGARTATRIGDLWAVDMGPARIPSRPATTADPGGADSADADDDWPGWDTAVVIPGIDGPRAGLSVAMTGAAFPRIVIALADEAELDAASPEGADGPGSAVRYEPEPSEPVALDAVVPLGEETDPASGAVIGVARWRALSRSAGAAPSTGMGCCAAAAALHEWEGEGAPESYRLLLPGEEIGVHVGHAGDAGAAPGGPGESMILTGQARLIARVTVL